MRDPNGKDSKALDPGAIPEMGVWDCSKRDPHLSKPTYPYYPTTGCGLGLIEFVIDFQVFFNLATIPAQAGYIPAMPVTIILVLLSLLTFITSNKRS
ncbi:hypothetical protein RclHR1_00460032 [Rhizophagus clarus]|nr:hypothetical protein RclHR1_00460032 [Rhizophagus clarus]GES80065.1 hypothetical protein RCL_jg23020.t1 [Rhizophagus clarus]